MVEVMDVKKIADETKKKMTKSVESTKKEFQNIRTGRASIALVEGIQVNYYNTPTPIKNLGTISTPDARTIQIQPWDATAVAEIVPCQTPAEFQEPSGGAFHCACPGSVVASAPVTPPLVASTVAEPAV